MFYTRLFQGTFVSHAETGKNKNVTDRGTDRQQIRDFCIGLLTTVTQNLELMVKMPMFKAQTFCRV